MFDLKQIKLNLMLNQKLKLGKPKTKQISTEKTDNGVPKIRLGCTLNRLS